ncbi:MAG: hypothetical protein KZQ74_13495 [gamma proteobacterium symbiont of Bathyaustriella thionipta]|nr:hypothetical protein [gamma proteobacterium symbiont of Bathyaustriella thionipta]MCU7955958.1 hypothetical protein [gamma proteobacterium symbiont of Bathyaustriella thionipta]MCU7968184.1 hypothetical protein [gamma proteobacterium symbiont of Bathyaustriella thionipta]
MNMQLLGNSLLKEGDLLVAGARYSETDNSDTISLLLNTRYPIKRHWRVNPRIRVDYRENTNGTTQWLVAPLFQMSYIWNKKTTFEFEAGAEIIELELLDGDIDETKTYFLYAGYRYDF